ncbi:hypothetical protein [Streptomyces flaveus]|uniref:hypothetical protein n=1 Tax=Streptomyces flaveus TaxID=66370 RepID=UPI00332EE97E
MTNPRIRWSVGAVALMSLSLSACGSGFDDTGEADDQASAGPASIKVLIASSGDAETKAVKDAAQTWAGKSGNKATVTQAQDITQQLGQGFASNNPPDVFYVDAKFFATYASAGSLEPYGDSFPGKDDFYRS